ncbi:MAG: hypothetical protein JWR80_4762 [Bradyrhizobium sp.]|nr:hypothetical protein [Bradyrhizobium sp.]
MSKLDDVLIRYTPNRIGQGDNFDPEEFRKSLARLVRDLRWVYAANALMIGVVFVVEAVVAIVYIKEPAVLTGIAIAVGATIAGGIERMSRLAKEMAETSLLVILSEKLPQERIEKIVEILVERLRPPPSIGNANTHPAPTGSGST